METNTCIDWSETWISARTCGKTLTGIRIAPSPHSREGDLMKWRKLAAITACLSLWALPYSAAQQIVDGRNTDIIHALTNVMVRVNETIRIEESDGRVFSGYVAQVSATVKRISSFPGARMSRWLSERLRITNWHWISTRS